MGRANEIAESEKQKAKNAEVELAIAREALKKPLKMVENYNKFPDVGTPQDREDAAKKLKAAQAKIAKDEAALSVAQAKETAALESAKDLQLKREKYAEYYTSVMNQDKKY